MKRLSAVTTDERTDEYSRGFARWVSCQVDTGAAGPAATANRFLEKYPPRTVSHEAVKSFALITSEVDLDGKAAIAAGNTSDANWAGPLAAPKDFEEAFLAVARPREIVDQLPGVMRVPPNLNVPTWTPNASSSAAWVHEGAIKPLASFAFGSAKVVPAKVAILIAVTRELLELGGRVAEDALRDVLAFQISTGTNEEFILPARAAVANERPGSVTNAGTLIATANNAVTDAGAVLAALQAARPSAQPVLILDPTAAAALIATGQHRDLSLAGGTAFGATVIVSASAGKTIAAVDPAAVLLWDDGVRIDASKHATIVLDSAPPSDASQVVTSAFQSNLIVMKAERFIAWKLTTAVACHHATRA